MHLSYSSAGILLLLCAEVATAQEKWKLKALGDPLPGEAVMRLGTI
jgi:hypothetical protein